MRLGIDGRDSRTIIALPSGQYKHLRNVASFQFHYSMLKLLAIYEGRIWQLPGDSHLQAVEKS